MQTVNQARIQDEPRHKVMRPTHSRFEEYCHYAAYSVGLTARQVKGELKRQYNEQQGIENVW